MAKIKKVRQHGFQSKAKLPAVVQMRKTQDFLQETERQAAKMRRLLWLAIKMAGGRIEIPEDEYVTAVQMSATDSIVGVEHDKEKKLIVLVFHDEHGKTLPESEAGKIIITD